MAVQTIPKPKEADLSGTFYSTSRIYRANLGSYQKALYPTLQAFYLSNGLNNSRTIVIGASHGYEVPQNFPGTLVDLDRAACEVARKERPNATVACSDATDLRDRFPDGRFGSVVLSLILSPLKKELGSSDLAFKAYMEGERILSENGKLFIADTTFMTTTEMWIASGELQTKVDTYRYFDLASIVQNRSLREVSSFIWTKNSPIITTPNESFLGRETTGVKFKVDIMEVLRSGDHLFISE